MTESFRSEEAVEILPRVYDNCYAKCPFFLSSGRQHIMCEGITSDCAIDLVFISEERRNLHRRIFCDDKYKNCEIHKTLEKKYEE